MSLLHPISVNRLTARLQVHFRERPYALQMDLQQLLTTQDRIAWAIERAKKSGLPPEQLAAMCGVRRRVLFHWTKETTRIEDVGIGALMRFAQATGVNLDWLMTGRGDPIKTYTPSSEVEELAHALEHLAAEEPAEYRVISRMIRTAATSHEQDKPPN